MSIIIAVLHYNWKFIPQGYLTVEFFFAISGFLIEANHESYEKKLFGKIIVSKVSKLYLYYLGIILLFYALELVINKRIVGIVSMIKYIFMIDYIFGGG